MKRLFILFALAAALCVGMAALCTACAGRTDASSTPENTGAASSSASQEAPATPLPTATPAPLEDTASLEEPDLQGVIRTVGPDSFTISPIHLQSEGEVAVAAAGASDQQETVTLAGATIETMSVYNGGHGTPQPADTAALEAGKQVYLYGQATETGFAADRILVLEIEADTP